MALQVWLPFTSSDENQGLTQLPAYSANSLTEVASGKLGKCYSGANAGGRIYHLTEDILGNAFSIAMWIKSDTWNTSGNRILCCKNTSTAKDGQFYFSVTNATSINIGVNSVQAGMTYAYTFSTDTWYHVATTFDGTTVALYINGTQVKTGTVSRAKPTALNLGIGCRSANAAGTSMNSGAGTLFMNDVRIYDNCISAREIELLSKGLVLHYPLDQSINGTVFDTSGFCNNGTVSGVTVSSDTPRYSASTVFDGSDDYISVTSSALYQVIQGDSVPFTIATWIYRADATRAVVFGDYGLSGSISFNIELTTSHKARFYWAASPDKTFSGALTASAWNHVAIVYDGTKLQCYLNGELTDTYTVTLTQKTKTSGEYRLGRDNRTGTTAFNGNLSDFRIYATALTAEQVKQLYEAPISLANNGTLFANELVEV